MAIGKKTAEDSVHVLVRVCVCGGKLPHCTDTLIKTVNKNKKVGKKRCRCLATCPSVHNRAKVLHGRMFAVVHMRVNTVPLRWN